MLVLILNSRVYLSLKLLLLLFPFTLTVYPTSLESVTLQTNLIENIIEKANNEMPINTLLVLKDGTDLLCPLNDFNSVAFPTLRMDQSTTNTFKEALQQGPAGIAMSIAEHRFYYNHLSGRKSQWDARSTYYYLVRQSVNHIGGFPSYDY